MPGHLLLLTQALGNLSQCPSTGPHGSGGTPASFPHTTILGSIPTHIGSTSLSCILFPSSSFPSFFQNSTISGWLPQFLILRFLSYVQKHSFVSLKPQMGSIKLFKISLWSFSCGFTVNGNNLKTKIFQGLKTHPKESYALAPLPSWPVPSPILSIPERGDEPHKAVWQELLDNSYKQVLRSLGTHYSQS